MAVPGWSTCGGSSFGFISGCQPCCVTEGGTRSAMLPEERILEILEAFDLTLSYRAAGALCGVDHHTVKRYVTARAAGLDPTRVVTERPRLADPFADKVLEWIDRSSGRIRADV